NILCTVWAAGTVALIVFVPSFLAVRGLAMLFLLAAGLMLDSAFLVDNPAKFVVTILAYIWAIAGITFVASPYLLRDLLDKVLATKQRFIALVIVGLVLGFALLGLGIFVY